MMYLFKFIGMFVVLTLVMTVSFISQGMALMTTPGWAVHFAAGGMTVFGVGDFIFICVLSFCISLWATVADIRGEMNDMLEEAKDNQKRQVDV